MNNGSIADNVFSAWDQGNINYTADNSTGNYPNIKNNYGIDLGDSFPVLEQSSSPSVAISPKWKTNNSSSATISDFSKASDGKEIFVEFGDSNTTVQFSGDTHLKGNLGMDDWHPLAGNHMRCTKEGAYWYCECFNNTP